MIALAVICSFLAYWVGAAVSILPGVNLPGFGAALAVIVMGAFLMLEIRRGRRGR